MGFRRGENMDYFTKKERMVIILLVLVIVLISCFNFLKKNDSLVGEKSNEKEVDPEELIMELEDQLEDEVEDEDEDEGTIMVHISGEIYNPGLVELPYGSRVIDAVNLAGGLKKEADLDKINLAKKLSDEEKIYIPKVGEDINPIEDFTGVQTGVQNDSINGKININTCTKEQLMSLPGIGEVLAGRILEYREQNQFKNIEDIKNVSGIGEKKFESIKELITTR